MTAPVPPRSTFGWVARSLIEAAAGPDPDEIPRRLVAEPIMAWKIARLSLSADGGEFMFRPLSAPGQYGTDEEAECRYVPGATPMFFGATRPYHRAPDPRCACGFYARKERRGPSVDQVVLRVSLSGTVIVHQDGYRAQRQQVIGVEVPDSCVWCPERATRIEVPDPVDHYRRVAPVCVDCGDRTIGIADLAGGLGVDVTWCEVGPNRDRRINVIWGVSANRFARDMQRAMDSCASARGQAPP